MLFGVCVEHNMIGSCLLRYSYSFKLENNCYSVYMNKTFHGHTPNVNGLLNLDHSDTQFIIFIPKDAKLIMIVQHICGTAVLIILV